MDYFPPCFNDFFLKSEFFINVNPSYPSFLLFFLSFADLPFFPQLYFLPLLSCSFLAFLMILPLNSTLCLKSIIYVLFINPCKGLDLSILFEYPLSLLSSFRFSYIYLVFSGILHIPLFSVPEFGICYLL